MEESVIQRIKIFIKESGLSVNSVANKAKIPQSTLATALKRDNGIGADIVGKIISAYPLISTDWLLTGNGNMLKQNPSNDTIANLVEGVSVSYDKSSNSNITPEQYIKMVELKDRQLEIILRRTDNNQKTYDEIIQRLETIEKQIHILTKQMKQRDAKSQ